jgi:hypothetical protein
MEETPHLRAFPRIVSNELKSLKNFGWRRSGIRTGLQPNTLLTGNFTGNFALLRINRRSPAQETSVSQAYLAKFPTQINRENFSKNSDRKLKNREFNEQDLRVVGSRTML